MKFGLIGNPVAHSKSPALFKAAYGDSQDSYDLIECTSFDDAYRIFLDKYDAVNVTMPFKEAAFAAADECGDRHTARIMAANILKKEHGKVKCYNSDYLGVKNIITRFILEAENILVVGNGGAGRAAALAAYDCGFNITIANRSREKAENWIRNCRLDDMKCCGLENMPLGKNDIIIYTLPVLAEGFPKMLLNGRIVLEANYASPVLADGKERYTYISGEEWLREQADFGFGILREKIC